MNRLVSINSLYQPIRDNGYYHKLGIDTVNADSPKDILPLMSDLHEKLSREEYDVVDNILQQTDFSWLNMLCIVTVIRSLCNHIDLLPSYPLAMKRAIRVVEQRNQDPLNIFKCLIERVEYQGKQTYEFTEFALEHCERGRAFLKYYNLL